IDSRARLRFGAARSGTGLRRHRRRSTALWIQFRRRGRTARSREFAPAADFAAEAPGGFFDALGAGVLAADRRDRQRLARATHHHRRVRTEEKEPGMRSTILCAATILIC